MVIFTRNGASMARLAEATEAGTLPSEKVGYGSFFSFLGAIHRDEHELT